MAYSEKLAERIRAVLPASPPIDEKRMFGGLAFMTGGKMFCGVLGEDLMARVGPDAYEDALAWPPPLGRALPGVRRHARTEREAEAPRRDGGLSPAGRGLFRCIMT